MLFMMGFPTESEEEIGQTVSFATELNPTYASFHIATPYPGTPMYEDFQVLQDGHFIEERYEQALPLPLLKRLERKAYLQYYLRPGYLGAKNRTGMRHLDKDRPAPPYRCLLLRTAPRRGPTDICGIC